MAGEHQKGIDYDGLYARVSGDIAFAHELVGIFLYDGPTKLRDLEEAIANGQDERVEKIAHSLKGTAATIKAKSFEAIAFDLEAAARNRDSSKWVPLHQHLSAAFEDLAAQAVERGIEPTPPE